MSFTYNNRMHAQMKSKALLNDRWVQFEQNVWADKEGGGYRYLGFVVSNQCLDFILCFFL